jgi:hypothetical protein
MTTGCNTASSEFQGLGGRQVVGGFCGGDITSDAGGLLLREVEGRTGIIGQFAACFTDHRAGDLIEHARTDHLPPRHDSASVYVPIAPRSLRRRDFLPEDGRNVRILGVPKSIIRCARES